MSLKNLAVAEPPAEKKIAGLLPEYIEVRQFCAPSLSSIFSSGGKMSPSA